LDLAQEKNWGTKPDEIIFGEKLALLHAEISEVLEAYRKGKMKGRDSVAEELGDVVLRALHLAGIFDIDLEKEIGAKISFTLIEIKETRKIENKINYQATVASLDFARDRQW